MPEPRRGSFRWVLTGALLVGVVAAGAWWYPRSAASTAGHGSAETDETGERVAEQAVRVNVVRPKVGEMDRVTTQIGTVQAYETVNLYARVSGFLKAQAVDIGDRVKKEAVLA